MNDALSKPRTFFIDDVLLGVPGSDETWEGIGVGAGFVGVGAITIALPEIVPALPTMPKMPVPYFPH